MKNFKILFILMLSAFMGMQFVSCSSDDDENTDLKTPLYESASAKYKITESSADIQSIELTASGNYIIVKKYGYYAPGKRSLAYNIFMHREESTRATAYDNIVYGKFVNLGDNKYDLEGWGIVTITQSEGEYVNISIVKDGKEEVFGARKEEQFKSSTATDNLCRSWEISKMGIAVEIGGRKFDKMANHDNLKGLFKDYINWLIEQSAPGVEVPEEEINELINEYINQYNAAKPLYVIFTKSGSYMVHYTNEIIGISTWRWENENENVIRYSWDHSDINNGGTCDISYSGNMLLVKETQIANGAKVSVTYGMTEIK